MSSSNSYLKQVCVFMWCYVWHVVYVVQCLNEVKHMVSNICNFSIQKAFWFLFSSFCNIWPILVICGHPTMWQASAGNGHSAVQQPLPTSPLPQSPKPWSPPSILWHCCFKVLLIMIFTLTSMVVYTYGRWPCFKAYTRRGVICLCYFLYLACFVVKAHEIHSQQFWVHVPWCWP